MSAAPPSPPSRSSPAVHGGRSARHRHRLFLALGCALVLLLLGSSHWQATSSLQALGELQRQAERVEHLDSLWIQLMDAENAVRGYLLTGNRAHLEPYAGSRTTATGMLETIRNDMAGNENNDSALADLAGLVAIKLRSLDQAVERGTAGEETRLQGKRYTDRIGDRILGLKTLLAMEGESSFTRSTNHVQRTRWVIAALAVGALTLMALLLLVVERQFRLREQLADLLEGENRRLDGLVQERTGELSELATYLTNVREVEKARLARELHDELGALLTAAKMESGWIARHLDETELAPCRERLARLDEHLDAGIALKRRIIDNLRPPLLDMLGLVAALRTLGEEFACDAGETLTMDLPAADIPVAPEPALALYRIAQEALTNIRKHAHARQVKLALRVLDGTLELEIEDNGQGFRSGGPEGRRHHGLTGMKHRVQMCSGEFALTSRPGAGARITVRIPLDAQPTSLSVQRE